MSTAAVTEPPASSTEASAVAASAQDLPTMPESSIAAATNALNSALDAANIAHDEEAVDLPEGPQAGDVDTDGKVKTVFDDATAFNVKVSCITNIAELENL